MPTLHFDAGELQLPDGRILVTHGWVLRCDGKRISDNHYAFRRERYGSTLVEYDALAFALRAWFCAGFPSDKILIYGDNKVVMEICGGLAQPRCDGMVKRAGVVRALCSKFNHVNFTWIPREKNVEADALCRLARSAAFKEVDRERKKAKDLRLQVLSALRIEMGLSDRDIPDWCDAFTGVRRLSNASCGDMERMLRHIQRLAGRRKNILTSCVSPENIV